MSKKRKSSDRFVVEFLLKRMFTPIKYGIKSGSVCPNMFKGTKRATLNRLEEDGYLSRKKENGRKWFYGEKLLESLEKWKKALSYLENTMEKLREGHIDKT